MNYWEDRYQNETTGWDIGYPTPAIINYFKDVDKSSKILIPGCGNAYEAEYLYNEGFQNVVLIDIASTPLKNFQDRVPHFPKQQLINSDYFEFNEQFDYIVEQTFFCAIDRTMRRKYAEKTHSLLALDGHLIGLLWSVEINNDHPPYGGNRIEYDSYFSDLFEYKKFKISDGSIPQRMGREYFIEMKKKK